MEFVVMATPAVGSTGTSDVHMHESTFGAIQILVDFSLAVRFRANINILVGG